MVNTGRRDLKIGSVTTLLVLDRVCAVVKQLAVENQLASVAGVVGLKKKVFINSSFIYLGYLLHSNLSLHHVSGVVCQRNEPSRRPAWHQVLLVPQSRTARWSTGIKCICWHLQNRRTLILYSNVAVVHGIGLDGCWNSDILFLRHMLGMSNHTWELQQVQQQLL